jgi:hypothetical protein
VGEVPTAFWRGGKVYLIGFIPCRVTVRPDSAAVLALGVTPEGDFGMGLGQQDELLDHGGLDDCVIIQEPDAFRSFLISPSGSEVATCTEPGVLMGGEHQEVRMDVAESCCQSVPGTVVDDDGTMGEGFVKGQGL